MRFEDQALLAIVADDPGWVIAALGQESRDAIDVMGNAFGDLLTCFASGLPGARGFHVFEGALEVKSFGEDVDDVIWHGKWRPAALSDFIAFGLPLPVGAELVRSVAPTLNI